MATENRILATARFMHTAQWCILFYETNFDEVLTLPSQRKFKSAFKTMHLFGQFTKEPLQSGNIYLILKRLYKLLMPLHYLSVNVKTLNLFVIHLSYKVNM